MNNMRFDVPRSATFHLLYAAGDVAIKGWDQDAVELTIDGDPEQCQVEQQEGALVVRCDTAFSANVPQATSVQIEQVEGDLVLRDLMGPASVDTVAGDTLVQSLMGPLSIQNAQADLTTEEVNGPMNVQTVGSDARLRQHTAPVTMGTVEGDVRARAIHSPLQAGSVGGDVRVHGATAPVTVEQGAADFVGEDLVGGMDVRVNGDVKLKTTLTPGVRYRARAQGDIKARFPGSASAHFDLRSQGTLSAKLPQVETDEPGHMVGQVGAGEAEVDLQAQGDLTLKLREKDKGFEAAFEGFEADFAFTEDIAQQIESQIAETLEGLDIDGLAQREIEKAMRRAQREIERAQEHAQRVHERVEQQARHAQERAERAARRAQERLSRRSFHGFTPFGPEAPPSRRPPKPRASEQEQLAVLKMVQEGKISAEEAEKLLRALEG